MSLGILWLKDAKVTHAWNNNMFAMQRNETIRIIIITKHLSNNTKKPWALLCYDLRMT
jgi:hypothetical protein